MRVSWFNSEQLNSHAYGGPAQSVYKPLCTLVPGITKVPAGYTWMSPEEALASHFSVPQSDLSYRPGRAWWAFRNVQDLADAAYAEVFPEIREARDALEKTWAEQ